jgi:transposase InsO family protein
MVNIKMNSISTPFKIDTGAAVTAVPSSFSHKIHCVQKPDKLLKGAANQKLQVIGKAIVTLSVGSKSITDTVYLIEGLVTPLLGKPAIQQLDLIRFVQEIQPHNNQWITRFPTLFQGLGSMGGEVKIRLKDKSEPFAQAVPRRIAAARKPPLKRELDRMVRMGVIQKIEVPTEWCSPCIVVPKPNGKIRVCIDFTRLNQSVKREYHPLPTTEDTLSMLQGAKVFSKVDANSGYWQMRLEESSQRLTAFITPFGRYICRRLPFGISSAPEIFQREMQKILVDLDGVVCQMDDILVFGRTQEEHDERLAAVFCRLKKSGVTLNAHKCAFSQNEIKFLGHIISAEGIKADPEKTTAIEKYPVPGNKKELRRFFGIVNYLGKFSPLIANNTSKLRPLLGNDCSWSWGEPQQTEFECLKRIISSTPTLTSFDITKETILSADASAYGLGAAILQKHDGVWKPVAYASRSLTATEQRYAQIEKEALAICWGCEKFDYFLAGRDFVVETDHKPLLPILGCKELAKLPLRIQRFRLKMMAYSYSIQYTPGIKLVLADALSRAPWTGTSTPKRAESTLVLELLDSLPVSDSRLTHIRNAMVDDPVATMLVRYITHGWPSSRDLPPEARPYYTFRDGLTVVEGVILYMNRLFIPEAERAGVLQDIHAGHLGEAKCVGRASAVLWWPKMSTDIREMVKTCTVCAEFRVKPREPLITTPLPDRPWWRLATDIFQMDDQIFLLTVDYFSRYVTVHNITGNMSTEGIVDKLEGLFYMLGIPNTLVSDNGPQFVSQQFQKFLEKLGIQHVTSSPRYPQSNGAAERAVRTIKSLMKKNVNFRAALCAYRDSPLECGYSPSQLLFGRSLNSMGIIAHRQIELDRLRKSESSRRHHQETNYNKRHRARQCPPFRVGQTVAVDDGVSPRQKATVIGSKGREVAVHTDSNQLLRRNRAHIYPRIENNMETGTQGQKLDNFSKPVDAPPTTGGVLAPHGSPNTPAETSSDVLASDSPPATPLPPTMTKIPTPRKSPQPCSSKAAKPKYDMVPLGKESTTRSGRTSRPPKRLNM